MKQIRVEIPGGYFSFGIREKEDGQQEAVLLGLSGPLPRAEVPGVIDDIPVTSVARKALLGNKSIRKLELPGSVEKIGEWAFANCSFLQEVRMGTPETEKGAFLGCDRLRLLWTPGDGSGILSGEDLAALLGAVAPDPESAYLCVPSEAGSESWIRKWDAKLRAFLDSPDDEGYSKQILCGEEDYGSTDLSAYESGRRIRKAEMCMLRLMHDGALPEDLREKLLSYVLAHRAGSEEGEESWLAVLKNHPTEPEWIRFLNDVGAVTGANRDRMLMGVPEEYPELRAYLMNLAGEGGPASFFDSLAL